MPPTFPVFDDAALRRAVRSLDDPPPASAAVSTVIGRRASRAAVVLVPVVRRAEAPSLLFTRRTEHLRHHAGQISFPGGGVEPDDADVIAAALRETCEETGIAPALVEPFGFLDRFDSVSGYDVTPVVGFVQGDYSARLHADEVDEIFEVPLPFVLEPGRLQREQIVWLGRERDVFSLVWEGRRIWGLTAAILKNLVDRLESAA